MKIKIQLMTKNFFIHIKTTVHIKLKANMLKFLNHKSNYLYLDSIKYLSIGGMLDKWSNTELVSEIIYQEVR